MKNILYFTIIVLMIGVSCTKEGSSDSGEVFTDQSGQGGSMAKFSISGDHLFVINDRQLKTYNISDATHPNLLGTTNVDFGIETVFTLGEYLFIGSINGMYIYDIANPENIQKVSYYQHITSCDPVVANDSLAFVTLNSGSACFWQGGANRLDVLDIENKIDPKLLSSISLLSPKGLGLKDNYVFVCNSQEGVEVYDFSNPNDLNKVSRISGIDAYDLIIRGELLFLIGKDGLFQYHIADVNNIELISQLAFE